MHLRDRDVALISPCHIESSDHEMRNPDTGRGMARPNSATFRLLGQNPPADPASSASGTMGTLSQCVTGHTKNPRDPLAGVKLSHRRLSGSGPVTRTMWQLHRSQEPYLAHQWAPTC